MAHSDLQKENKRKKAIEFNRTRFNCCTIVNSLFLCSMVS